MATDGFGATMEGASSGVIGEIIEVQSPGGMRTKLPTTTHSSTDGWRTSDPSEVKEMEDTTLTLFYVPAMETTLFTMIDAAAEAWTITFSDSATFVCDGYLLSFVGDAVPVDDHMRRTLTFAWTGVPAYTE